MVADRIEEFLDKWEQMFTPEGREAVGADVRCLLVESARPYRMALEMIVTECHVAMPDDRIKWIRRVAEDTLRTTKEAHSLSRARAGAINADRVTVERSDLGTLLDAAASQARTLDAMGEARVADEIAEAVIRIRAIY